MGNHNQFDEALVAAYREQSAPAHVQRELIEQFEASSQRSNYSWHFAVFGAVFAICAVTAVLHLKLQSSPPNVLPTRLTLSLSTASFRPLPTLSGIKLSAQPEEVSLLNLKSRPLPGWYRKSISLTKDVL